MPTPRPGQHVRGSRTGRPNALVVLVLKYLDTKRDNHGVRIYHIKPMGRGATW